MTLSYSGILVAEHGSDRTTDDITAAQYDGVGTGDGYASGLEKTNNGGRRAGSEEGFGGAR